MLRSQIEEFKANIKAEYEARINKLKAEMEDALKSLSTVEERLFDVKAMQDYKPVQPQPMTLRRAHQLMRSSIPDRMNLALSKTRGEFSRKQLFQMILTDGGVQVADGSLAAVFADLVKNKTIVAVKESVGKTAGVYRKAEELRSRAESSPASEVD
jgi:hypothetical protein